MHPYFYNRHSENELSVFEPWSPCQPQTYRVAEHGLELFILLTLSLVLGLYMCATMLTMSLAFNSGPFSKGLTVEIEKFLKWVI